MMAWVCEATVWKLGVLYARHLAVIAWRTRSFNQGWVDLEGVVERLGTCWRSSCSKVSVKREVASSGGK